MKKILHVIHAKSRRILSIGHQNAKQHKSFVGKMSARNPNFISFNIIADSAMISRSQRLLKSILHNVVSIESLDSQQRHKIIRFIIFQNLNYITRYKADFINWTRVDFTFLIRMKTGKNTRRAHLPKTLLPTFIAQKHQVMKCAPHLNILLVETAQRQHHRHH